MPLHHSARVTTLTPAGIFIVRAWREDGRFRARITSSLDINTESELQTEVATAEPAEVSRHLAAWLRDMEKNAGG